MDNPEHGRLYATRCANDTDGDGNCAACARNPQALCRRFVLTKYTEARIAYLEARSSKLAALEAAGVDNWEGYGNALQVLEEDEDNE